MPAKPIVDAIRERALSFPHTEEAAPWGEIAFKVKGKVFVFMHAATTEKTIGLKLPNSAHFALSLPGAEPTHYGLGAKGWVTIPLTAKTPRKLLFDFIEESFRAVAPKRVVKELDGK